MERSEHYTQRINIEKLLRNGVIQEDIQNYRDSYAKQEFFQAIDVLKNIMRENDSFWQENGGYLDICGSKKATGKRKEIFNVIPFLGERGTGKTSTMLSFANILSDFDPENRKYDAFLLDQDERSRRRHESTKFIVLQYIDVGVLKSKEDIMAIILARMLKYVQKKLSSHPFGYEAPSVRQEGLRQLYQDFEQVYNDLLNLVQVGQELEGESVLRRLQNLNSSYSLAEKFQALVYEFLNFLSYLDGEKGKCRYYLIIALDDIDLFESINSTQDHRAGHIQRKDAYTICGQIYEYLQIPGVVVLTTYDENRLLSVCSRHIGEASPYLEKRECISQAVQYIQKFILPKYKIYMPNLDYADYPGERRLNINIGSEKNLVRVLFSEVVEKELSMKELILRYVAAIYGIYFDMEGTKQHFLEERNLRKFKNLFLALRVRDETSFKDAGTEQREQRYMHLLRYLYNQFAGEKLEGTEEFTLLHNWLSMPLERRSVIIFDYIQSKWRAILKQDSTFNLQANESVRTYNYGELIQSLYMSSRYGILSKEMVHCILASYSLVLSHVYDVYRSTADDKLTIQYVLRNVLGTSIAGQWSNEILYTSFWCEDPGDMLIPSSTGTPVKRTSESKIGSVATEKLPLAFRIKINDASIFDGIFNDDLPEQQVEQQKKKFRKFLNTLELLGMFFTNVRDTKRDPQQTAKTLKYGFVIHSQPEEDTTTHSVAAVAMDGQVAISPENLYLSASLRYACFNILNFVVNSFTPKEYFNALHGGLRQALFAWRKKNGRSTANNQWNEWIQECSLSDDFLKWSSKFGDCAIPFQHFDMTYNILKRQRDAADHGLPERANVSVFGKCCWQVYQNISDALKRQDDSYGGMSMFNKTFRQNPFIDTFERYKESDEFVAILAELAAALVREASELRRDNGILDTKSSIF